MFDPAAQSPMMGMQGPTGAQSAPTMDPGSMANAITQVGTAVQLLQQTLADPNAVPLGSDIHKTILDCIQKLSKVAPTSQQVPGVQATNLMSLQQKAQEDAMMQAVLRSLAGAQGGGAPSPDQSQQPQPAPQGGM